MALRVLWELARGSEPLTFWALQEAAQTNPSVLNARLKELRESRLVRHSGDGYHLTAEGRSLVALMLPLHEWAETWAALGPKPSAGA